MKFKWLPASVLLKQKQKQLNSSENFALRECLHNSFFEAGASKVDKKNPKAKGLHQLEADFLNRGFRVKGKKKLGFVDYQAINKLSQKEIDEEVEKRLIEELGKDKAEQLIYGNTQGIPGLIFNCLSQSIIGYPDVEYKIKQPREFVDADNSTVDSFPSEFSSNMWCRCYCDRFPVYAHDADRDLNLVIGYIKGPVESLFGYEEKEGVKGFELKQVNTDSELIISALEGKMITEDQLMQSADFVKLKHLAEDPENVIALLKYDCEKYQRYLLKLIINKEEQYPNNVYVLTKVQHIFSDVNHSEEIRKSCAKYLALHELLINELNGDKPEEAIKQFVIKQKKLREKGIFVSSKDPAEMEILKKIESLVLYAMDKASIANKSTANLWQKALRKTRRSSLEVKQPERGGFKKT